MNIASQILLLCLLFSINVFAQKQFTLNAFIDGLPDGSKIYLTKIKGADTVSTTVSQNGNFTFKGGVTGMEIYFIKLDTSISKKSGTFMFLINAPLKLTSTADTWPEMELTGSKEQTAYIQYEELIKRASESIKAAGADSVLRKQKENERNEGVEQFIVKHKNLYAAPIILNAVIGLLPEQTVKTLAAKFPKPVMSTIYGQSLQKSIQAIGLKEGSLLPDFAVTTLDGKKISVKEFVSKNKLTLIDFWASWCKPCRAEVPNIKKVYEKYHEKGFDVIGIAYNDQESYWRKAVQEDNSPWLQAKDNIDNACASIFRFQGIPAFILVNHEAKVVACYSTSSIISTFGPALRGDTGNELYSAVEGILR